MNDIAEISTLTLKPGQILVVRCSMRMTREQREIIKSHVEKFSRNNPVLVLDSVLELQVLDQTAGQAA